VTNPLVEAWREKRNRGHLGKAFIAANQKFLRSLLRLPEKKLNTLADELHEEVFAQVDCLSCAGCCSSIPPIVNDTDIKRISRHLRLKPAQFSERYVRLDEDGDQVISRTPCPFLGQDLYCSIYEVRPKACREYPHTDNMTFRDNIRLHAINATYCPGVYYILEKMKSLND
jgi:Fe-S-cluster containining protein